jgi:glycosidase
MRYFIFLLLGAVLGTSCSNDSKVQGVQDGEDSVNATLVDGHPSWIMQGNVYEVNLRQYTKEGTIKAFEQHLPRLKEMGVQTLWFMPIHPISKTDRKGVLGSYYAVADYKGVNPEFGTMEDWKALVKRVHGMDMKVIIDWVPNHTGADHPWLTTNPDFYTKDAMGKPAIAFDWADVRDLDYSNPKLTDSMIAAMKFWVTETDIDGFRCDVAGEVPKEFWSKCVKELKATKNIFMLAESNDAWLHEVGFDASYPWDAFTIMKDIAKGKRTPASLDTVIRRYDSTKTALRLFFTSNHDENSWNKADYGTMPGEVHAPFAILTQTIAHSVPLIYSGQEEPLRDSLSFFYKDSIEWKNFERASFYKTLLQLRAKNPALAANASFKKLKTGNDNALYCYEREKDGNKVLVVLNLSNRMQQLIWKESNPSENNWVNVFSGEKEQPVGFSLGPWGYGVYELRN